jgi:hypothetical protein
MSQGTAWHQANVFLILCIYIGIIGPYDSRFCIYVRAAIVNLCCPIPSCNIMHTGVPAAPVTAAAADDNPLLLLLLFVFVQYGDVFSLRLLGQRMVFVFDPAMLTLFFKAPESSISFK